MQLDIYNFKKPVISSDRLFFGLKHLYSSLIAAMRGSERLTTLVNSMRS